MNYRTSSRGFTVLELLVVIGILSILVGLVLTGLNSARQRSNDDREVGNLKEFTLGLHDYFSICRAYPETATGAEGCPELLDANGNPKTLADLVPIVTRLNINGNGSSYHYAGLVDAQSATPTECTNFHAWVDIKGVDTPYKSQESNMREPYTYAGNPLVVCGVSEPGIPGGTPDSDMQYIFDIFK